MHLNMHIEGKTEALKALRRGEASLIHTCCEGDLLTPVLGYLRLRRAFGGPWSFLLESVEGGEQRGRFSFIGLCPDLWWRYRGTHAQESLDGTHWRPLTKPPLAAFEDLLKASQLQFSGLAPQKCRPGCSAISAIIPCAWSKICQTLFLRDPPRARGPPRGRTRRPTREPIPGRIRAQRQSQAMMAFFLRPQLLVIFDRLVRPTPAVGESVSSRPTTPR